MVPVLSLAALAEGEMAACEVAGKEILVCHVEGQFYAISNRCSHAGQKLSLGKLRGFELSCPLHRATFDVRTGHPLKAPASEAIARFPVTLAEGKINVTVVQ